MDDCFEIKKCEVCNSTELTPVLDLGAHPLCDDLVPVKNSAICEKSPIEILYCTKCDTAHQRYQVPKIKLFPQTYHYRSRFTADVLLGMQALTDSVEKNKGSLVGLKVLDVGCNDGSLLDKFSAKGAITIGIEPTGAYADAEGRGHVIYNDFFSAVSARKILNTQGRIDLITFTNVFAHIEDLPGLLLALKSIMNEDTTLVVENHYLGAVLGKNQFDTFYHEHPRTYSLHSFVHIAKSLGREVVDVEFPHRYGGNIRVIIGKTGTRSLEISDLIASILKKEVEFLDQFRSMNSFMVKWKKDKKEQINQLVSKMGKLKAKAFPGRAAILVELLGLSAEQIDCVYEKPGSLKIGHYLPGTRIPIRSDDDLFENINQSSVLLNLAWHIPVEIDAYLRQNGYKGEIVNIV